MTRAARIIARKELRDALRNHWLQGYAILLATLGLVVALAGQRGAAGLGLQTFGRTTASLTNLCLMLAPLVALMLGAAAIAGERDRGTLERLLAQPLDRSELLGGKHMGLLTSLLLATLIGFLPAAVVIGMTSGAGALISYALFPAMSMLVITAVLSVGVLISVRSDSGGQAQARAVFLWFVFVLLYDLLLVGTLMAASLQAWVLGLLLLLNPVSAGRVLVVLALEADLYMLGPAGAWMVETLGTAGAAAALVGSLLAWSAITMVAAQRSFRLGRGPGNRLPMMARIRSSFRRSNRGRSAKLDDPTLERIRT